MTIENGGEYPCPKCGNILRYHESTGGRASPEPNDVYICAGCLTVLKFDANLSLAEPTPEELAEIMSDERVSCVINAIKSGMKPDNPPQDTSTHFIYEGSSREALAKVIENRFGGQDSLDSRISSIFYLAMYDAIDILRPSVVDGKTAMEASEIISQALANVMVVLHVNLFPEEVRKQIMAVTMMNIAEYVPSFLAGTEEKIAEEKEKQETALRH